MLRVSNLIKVFVSFSSGDHGKCESTSVGHLQASLSWCYELIYSHCLFLFHIADAWVALMDLSPG